MPSQNVNSKQDANDYIIKSKLPPLKYPNISVAEYLSTSLTQKDPDSVALVSNAVSKIVHFEPESTSCGSVLSRIDYSQLPVTRKKVEALLRGGGSNI